MESMTVIKKYQSQEMVKQKKVMKLTTVIKKALIQEGNNEITLNNDEIEVENGKNENSGNEGHKQIRRSERIKKRRVEINPDDIGEDDNVNDKDYK